jgi:hypothetical protein
MTLLYAAGMDKNEHRRFRESCAKHVRNFMLTYFDYRGIKGQKYWLDSIDQLGMWRPDARLFLDSGAFSAFTLGQPISLDEYMRFLELFEDQFYMYASLDNKADQAETYANYKQLRKSGFNPAPVWHAIGGPEAYLEEYFADANVPYVCVGAIAKEKIQDHIAYQRLNLVFRYVGQYKKPVHAFGRTEPELLVRYPFTSADSSTWYVVRMGAILHWNPINKTLRQIRMRNATEMERCFGPHAKVLIGHVPESYGKPHYIVATEHNLEQTYQEETFLVDYWKARGVVWDFDLYDRSYHGHCAADVIDRCRFLRKKAGIAVPGDDDYTPGMYVGLNPTNKVRSKQKWERQKIVKV